MICGRCHFVSSYSHFLASSLSIPHPSHTASKLLHQPVQFLELRGLYLSVQLPVFYGLSSYLFKGRGALLGEGGKEERVSILCFFCCNKMANFTLDLMLLFCLSGEGCLCDASFFWNHLLAVVLSMSAVVFQIRSIIPADESRGRQRMATLPFNWRPARH